MNSQRTTAAIQQYLDDLETQKDIASEEIVRELLGRSAQRLHVLCGTMLYRSYPRLARPPVNLHATEMLSAVVERLLKALRKARPGNVRQFFHIASQHMRWELNDVARRVDQNAPVAQLRDQIAVAPRCDDAGTSSNAVRILDAIARLPAEQREVFDLIRIQGMTQNEVAELLDISVRTVQRRVNSCILSLTEELADMRGARVQVGNL